jgi:hypothetical protein
MNNNISEVKILASDESLLSETSQPPQTVTKEEKDGEGGLFVVGIAIVLFLIVTIIGGGFIGNMMQKDLPGSESRTGTSTSTTSDAVDSLLLTQ